MDLIPVSYNGIQIRTVVSAQDHIYAHRSIEQSENVPQASN